MSDPLVEAVVEQLPAVDPPSPKAKRIAAGFVLVEQGKSYREAAAIVGIPTSTLWAAHNHVRPADARSESFAAIEAHIEDLSAELTAKVAERLLARVEEGSMRPAEEIKAMQVARDTLSMRRDWGRGQAGDARAVNALAAALDAIRDKARADSKIDEAVVVSTIQTRQGRES